MLIPADVLYTWPPLQFHHGEFPISTHELDCLWERLFRFLRWHTPSVPQHMSVFVNGTLGYSSQQGGGLQRRKIKGFVCPRGLWTSSGLVEWRECRRMDGAPAPVARTAPGSSTRPAATVPLPPPRGAGRCPPPAGSAPLAPLCVLPRSFLSLQVMRVFLLRSPS